LKTARILDGDRGFGLEYDNNSGKRNTMRLDAKNYEKAVLEARLFLNIDQDNLDTDGTKWEVE
jgi:hypothetical protein